MTYYELRSDYYALLNDLNNLIYEWSKPFRKKDIGDNEVKLLTISLYTKQKINEIRVDLEMAQTIDYRMAMEIIMKDSRMLTGYLNYVGTTSSDQNAAGQIIFIYEQLICLLAHIRDTSKICEQLFNMIINQENSLAKGGIKNQYGLEFEKEYEQIMKRAQEIINKKSSGQVWQNEFWTDV